MKKCVLLEVANLKGTNLSIAEAGLFLDNGNQIIVAAEVVQRLKVQYKPFLVEVRDLEKERLSGGWYEVLRGKSDGAAIAAAPESAPNPEPEPATDPEPAPDPEPEPESKEMDEAPADKSMGSKRGKKKARTKKR